jgi:hypothetical protein
LLIPLLFGGGGIATAVGGWWSYRAVTNRAPVEMSCTDFAAHPPEADWVRVTGCEPNLESMGTFQFGTETSKRTTGMFVPMRPAGSWTRAPILVFVEGIDDGPGTEGWLAQTLSVPFSGLIERKLDRSQRSRREIQEIGLNVTPDFVVIDLDREPKPLPLAFGMLGVGLGALGFLGVLWKRRERNVEVPRATIVAG